MDSKSRQPLEDAGWVVGDTEEFLGLSEAESEFIRMKLALEGDRSPHLADPSDHPLQ
jgi:hypothetical protein